MKKGFALAIVLGIFGAYAERANAVSMNFTGNFRTEGFYLNKPGLGVAGVPSKNYLVSRALLQPNLVIDDHFSLKSEWSLLRSTAGPFAPGGGGATGIGMTVGNGGWVLGDGAPAAFNLNRVWLEWISDIGVMRIGRMPVDWGYGLLYDGGSRDPWDDWQSTLDRIEYRLHLGNVVGGIALSKPLKVNVLGDINDSIYYTAYIQYTNAESDLEGGIMYENQWHTASQMAALQSGASNQYRVLGSTTTAPGISTKHQTLLAGHVLDLYLKKTMGYFTVGGELSWITGKGTDYNGTGAAVTMNAYAALLRGSYEYHRLKVFLDFLFASGDSDMKAGEASGFSLLHRNRRPGLILGRELLGNFAGNNVHQGGCVMYGGADVFSGCIYLRPGVSFDWSASLSSGIELIIARKAQVGATDAANLGVELDLGTTYALYQNFDVGANVGILFPGDGLGVPGSPAVFAIRFTTAVKF